MLTVPVTLTAFDQSGNPVAGARITAKLNQTEIYLGLIVPEQISATADESGVAVLNLWPNALGVNGSMYRITAVNPDTGKKFLDAMASVPNSACSLHQIITVEPYPAIDASAQALAAVQAIQASLAAQLGFVGVYYGPLSADPVLDPLGAAVAVGDAYFNSTTNLFMVYNGATWQASDINTANLAASGGSALVGHLPADAGAATTVQAILRGEDVPAPARRGFWTNDAGGANVHRLRDRVFIGEAVKHTGRSAAPYGATWLTEKVGTWPEKNAQTTILSSEEKIGLLTGAQATAAGGASVIGLASFSYNERPGGTARAIYADATHCAGAAASYGIEVATNNTGTNVQTNSYDLTGGVIGIHMTPEGGSGYTLGDADSAAPVATSPSTVAINISTGSGGTANKRWNLGIRFQSNSLTADGSGNATAMSMGQGHTLEWMASSSIYGARIRSKVTAVAGQDVGLQFENNLVSIRGAAMAATIADFTPVASGVNNFRMTNAIAGNFPSLTVVGSDANIGMFLDSKGTGNIRLRTNGGLTETLRITHTASGVNFFNFASGAAGAPPRLDAIGADTNIDAYIAPKGTGVLRLGYATSAAATPASFTADRTLAFRDSSGTIYYIPARTATW